MADYAAIINAIDTAITGWAARPVSITSPMGGTLTYRSLKELIEARIYYAKLAAKSNNKKGFTITHLKSGGARS